MHINDAMFTALRGMGYQGAVPDMLLKYYNGLRDDVLFRRDFTTGRTGPDMTYSDETAEFDEDGLILEPDQVLSYNNTFTFDQTKGALLVQGIKIDCTKAEMQADSLVSHRIFNWNGGTVNDGIHIHQVSPSFRSRGVVNTVFTNISTMTPTTTYDVMVEWNAATNEMSIGKSTDGAAWAWSTMVYTGALNTNNTIRIGGLSTFTRHIKTVTIFGGFTNLYNKNVPELVVPTYKNIPDATYQFLKAKGLSSKTTPDMWYEYLSGLSFTGALPDMQKQYWESLI